MAVTWTQADINSLKDAIKGGVLSVSYAGPPQRSMTYQNLDSMRKLLAEMIRDVNEPQRFRRVQVKRGFRD